LGGYRRDIANKILRDGYAVALSPLHRDADCEFWEYVRELPGGEKAVCVMSFEVGLAAYPPDTLRRLCEDLGLGREFDAIRRKIMDLGGWVGRR
jgi:hypothetical protein